MATNEFRLPDPGEGLVEAEIVTWRVAVGDEVKVNDILVEIETAKSLVELPSPYAGTVTALLVDEGQLVDVGAPIVAISDGADEPVPDPATALGRRAGPRVAGDRGRAGEARVANLVGYGPRSTGSKRPRKGGPERADRRCPRRPRRHRQLAAPRRSRTRSRPAEARAAEDAPFLGGGPAVLAKPPVRKLAQDRGVDLTTLTGSGPGGIITREDVDRASAPEPAPARVAAAPTAAPTRPVPGRPPRRGRRTPTARRASPSRGCARRRPTRWCGRRSPPRT